VPSLFCVPQLRSRAPSSLPAIRFRINMLPSTSVGRRAFCCEICVTAESRIGPILFLCLESRAVAPLHPFAITPSKPSKPFPFLFCLLDGLRSSQRWQLAQVPSSPGLRAAVFDAFLLSLYSPVPYPGPTTISGNVLLPLFRDKFLFSCTCHRNG